MNSSVTGVVLAGGKSLRMGTNKAVLEIGGKKMLDRVVAELSAVCSEIVLVAGESEPYRYLGLPVLADIYPGCGPLAGIHTGLVAAKTPYIFVVGCDMPFIKAELMYCMAGQAKDHDVIIPRDGEYLEPLFALYGKGCIIPIENRLKKKRYKTTGFFPDVRVKYINRQELSCACDMRNIFININTPAELEGARRIVDDGEV